MYTNNPYAQGGWYNPDNPLSINNSTWGSQSPPQPSVYGALPNAPPPSPPKILTFFFICLNPTILNSTVVMGGPQSQPYFDIVTLSPSSSSSASSSAHLPALTIFRRRGEQIGVVEWGSNPPSVEIYGVVDRQAARSWLEFSNDRSHRSMQVRGKWYAWVPRERAMSLFTVSPNPPELVAKVSQETDCFKLEISAQAVQAGLLDAVIVATALLHSGL